MSDQDDRDTPHQIAAEALARAAKAAALSVDDLERALSSFPPLHPQCESVVPDYERRADLLEAQINARYANRALDDSLRDMTNAKIKGARVQYLDEVLTSPALKDFPPLNGSLAHIQRQMALNVYTGLTPTFNYAFSRAAQKRKAVATCVVFPAPPVNNFDALRQVLALGPLCLTGCILRAPDRWYCMMPVSGLMELRGARHGLVVLQESKLKVEIGVRLPQELTRDVQFNGGLAASIAQRTGAYPITVSMPLFLVDYV